MLEDAEVNVDADVIITDTEANGDGLAKQWARWASSPPCCYGQGSQASTCSPAPRLERAQFETQFAYLTASSSLALPFRIYRYAAEKNTRNGHMVRWSDGDIVSKYDGEIVSEIFPSSASLPADLEQHLGREQQHHHLPGDNDFQIV